MQYLALIYSDENVWESFSDEQRNAAYAQYMAFGEEARAEGIDPAAGE